MAVDFKTFISVVPHVTAVRKPVLVRGRHGVGKSQVVYQFAANAGLPVVERRASQMTEGDLLGLPSTDGAVTSWNPPEWYKTACETPVVLFLDEVDRATPEVRQGIFELTDSRKLAGFALHPETLIFAAVNGGEHGEQYQVGEMDPAELDRWTVFDVEPTVEDWLGWAKDNVHEVIWDFINQNHQHLEHSDDFEPNKVYPSRRSWDRLSECLTSGGMLDEGADLGIDYWMTKKARKRGLFYKTEENVKFYNVILQNGVKIQVTEHQLRDIPPDQNLYPMQYMVDIKQEEAKMHVDFQHKYI